MKPLWFAKVMGVLFIALGVIGFFVQEILWMHFDLLHNLIHLLVGTIAISSVMSGTQVAKRFARVAGIFFLVLALLGWVQPGFFGLMHVGEGGNIFHLIIGAAGIWTGYRERIYKLARETRSS